MAHIHQQKGEQMSDEMRIKDLQIDVKAPLSGDVRKQLKLVLEQEFGNQRTKYQHEITLAKEKILAEHRKKYGYAAKIKLIRHLQSELDEAQIQLKNIGLDMDGEILENHPYRNEKQSPEGKALRDMIEKLSDAHNPMNTLQNKLITRLYMATTIGEAAVIMREVMGNGELPSLTKQQFLIGKPNENA
jgi:hypothetical protein